MKLQGERLIALPTHPSCQPGSWSLPLKKQQFTIRTRVQARGKCAIRSAKRDRSRGVNRIGHKVLLAHPLGSATVRIARTDLPCQASSTAQVPSGCLKQQLRRNSIVLAIPTAPARSTRSLQSSKQPSNVTRWLVNAVIALATLAGSAFAPAPLSAQQADATHPSGHRIALVDVAYLFKNLPAIEAHASKIKADLRKEELEFQRRRDTLNRAAEQLQRLKVGSADYARQEEHLANLESQLRLHRIHRHRELSEAETRLYYDSYQQIAAAIRSIATDHEIDLVLNHRSEEMDLEQNDSVTRGVMKQVIYHDSKINLTEAVMRYLEQQANAPQATTSGNASSTTSR